MTLFSAPGWTAALARLLRGSEAKPCVPSPATPITCHSPSSAAGQLVVCVRPTSRPSRNTIYSPMYSIGFHLSSFISGLPSAAVPSLSSHAIGVSGALRLATLFTFISGIGLLSITTEIFAPFLSTSAGITLSAG